MSDRQLSFSINWLETLSIDRPILLVSLSTQTDRRWLLRLCRSLIFVIFISTPPYFKDLSSNNFLHSILFNAATNSFSTFLLSADIVNTELYFDFRALRVWDCLERWPLILLTLISSPINSMNFCKFCHRMTKLRRSNSSLLDKKIANDYLIMWCNQQIKEYLVFLVVK